MKSRKILGCVIPVAFCAMAVAASASATTVTTGLFTSTFPANVKLTNEFNINLSSSGLTATCTHSEMELSITSQGLGKTASGNIAKLTFTGCNQHVNVKANGTFEIHWTSGSNGTLTTSGTTIEVDYTTIFGTVHCNYKTVNTDLGTITGASEHGSAHATLHLLSPSFPIETEGSNGLCGATVKCEGAYKFTVPTGMTIDKD